MPARKVGRPRVSSREVIAEAACELFLERGFDNVSISDIAQRAGVSRSSFFNYATSKSGLLWIPVDDVIAGWADHPFPGGEPIAATRAALRDLARDVRPGSYAVVLAHAEAMGMTHEVRRECAARLAAIAAVIAAGVLPRVHDDITARVLSIAWAGAFMTALSEWASRGAAQAWFPDVLEEAFDRLPAAISSVAV